jgi:hypothetical protein
LRAPTNARRVDRGSRHTDMHIRAAVSGPVLPDGRPSSCSSAPQRAWPKPPDVRVHVLGVHNQACIRLHLARHRRAEPQRNVVGGLPGSPPDTTIDQATEDIAIFRGMLNLTTVDPCDSDIEQAVPQLAEHPGPPTCDYCVATCRQSSTNTTISSNSARQSAARRRRRGADLLGTDDHAGATGRRELRHHGRRRCPYTDDQAIRR